MKKLILLITTLLLLTGCLSNSIKQEDTEDYYLTYNNYAIKVGNDFKPLLALVGPYNSVRDDASSYYEGPAKIYSYDDFEVETFIENGIEKIYSITIFNENTVTNEGIHLFSTKQEMLVSYGLNYENPTSDVYTYSLKNSNIQFILNNDIIVSIKYYLK